MRKYLLRLLFLQISFSGSFCIYAQIKKGASLFRIYEDNDFLNIRGKGTDKAYSGGTRFDLFCNQKTGCRLFARILKPKNNSSINIAGWGFMQTIFTPNDISDPFFNPMIISTLGHYTLSDPYISLILYDITASRRNYSWV